MASTRESGSIFALAARLGPISARIDGKTRRGLVLLFVSTLVATGFDLLMLAIVAGYAKLLTSRGDVGSVLSWLPSLDGIDPRAAALLFTTGILFFIVLVKNMMQFKLIRVRQGIVDKMIVAAIRRIFAQQLSIPYSRTLRDDLGRVTALITEDVRRTFTLVVLPLIELVSDSLIGIALVGTLMVLEPLATLALLFCFGSSATLMVMLTRARSAQLGERASRHFDNVLRTITHAMGSLKESRVMRREVFFRRRMRSVARGYSAAIAGEHELRVLPRLWIETTLFASLLALTGVLVLSERQASDMVPILAVFALAGMRLLPFVGRTLVTISNLRLNHSMAMRVLDRLAIPTAMRPARVVPAGALTTFTDRLVCHDLGCGFELGRPLIRHLDFEIRKGEFLAVVGRSGIGKTTLIDTLLTLLDPVEGGITVDGQPMDTVKTSWRRLLGYVPQDPFVADDTLRANILFGLPSTAVEDEALVRLLERVGLGPLLALMPEGLQTRLGDRGMRLSGGQRQRLCLARTLLGAPEVLILDEGTAQLDIESERRIFADLRADPRGITVIVATHRPQTTTLCDRVLDLDRHMARPDRNLTQLERKVAGASPGPGRTS